MSKIYYWEFVAGEPQNQKIRGSTNLSIQYQTSTNWHSGVSTVLFYHDAFCHILMHPIVATSYS